MSIGVILSGCGVFDGSEIHESVLTLLALSQRGVAYQCMAPNKMFDAINHRTKQPTGEKRNVLDEAARIARGKIVDLATVKGGEYDAFILPGGFGAASNLCTFKSEGPQCKVDPQVERVLREAHDAGRPIGFICIAPAVAAAVFGKSLALTLTIGNDAGTAAALQQMGARHQNAEPRGVVTDEKNRIVSTPAYMYDSPVADVAKGIDGLVDRVVAMTRQPVGAA